MSSWGTGSHQTHCCLPLSSGDGYFKPGLNFSCPLTVNITQEVNSAISFGEHPWRNGASDLMVQYEYIRNIYPSGDDCKLRLIVEYLLCDCVIGITPVT